MYELFIIPPTALYLLVTLSIE